MSIEIIPKAVNLPGPTYCGGESWAERVLPPLSPTTLRTATDVAGRWHCMAGWM